MSEICVAHLVRKENGIAPLVTFLNSYKENSAGVAHDLVILFKGFESDLLPVEYSDLLAGLPYSPLFVPNEGFDIVPYFQAARALDYHYFCFLNSFSVLLDRDWLGRMYEHARQPGVGIAGATASYESLYSTYLHNWWSERSKWVYRGMLSNEYNKLREVLIYRPRFPAFPNYHVRSNAFLIRRDVILKLKHGPIKQKIDAHEFESGRACMTRQILNMDLKALVVGRDGRGYEKETWPNSFTFRNGEQQNLLVADNQTRHYQQADQATRRRLTEATWGKQSALSSSLSAL